MTTQNEPFSALDKTTAFPEIPNNCFDDELYCVKTDVVNDIDGNKRGFRIKIFAIVPDVETLQELNDIFLDFSKWPKYAARSSMDNIKYLKSSKLPNLNLDGKTVFRQLSHYKAKAPSPMYNMEVRALTHLWFVEPIIGACQSLEFENINIEDPQQLPEVHNFPGTTGVQYRKGSIHIRMIKYEDDFYENEKFLFFYTSDIVLSINLLPIEARPFVEGAHLAILKGMFEY